MLTKKNIKLLFTVTSSQLKSNYINRFNFWFW